MSHEATDRNPFMLMTNPEVILAAIEKSERLGKLNRHLCRPLDKHVISPAAVADEAALDVDGDEANPSA